MTDGMWMRSFGVASQPDWGGGNLGFDQPQGVAVGSDRVWGVDYSGGLAWFSLTGTALGTTSGPSPPSDLFGQPNEAAVDGQGNVYVADGGINHRIDKFDSTGAFVCQISDRGAAEPGGRGRQRERHGVRGRLRGQRHPSLRAHQRGPHDVRPHGDVERRRPQHSVLDRAGRGRQRLHRRQRARPGRQAQPERKAARQMGQPRRRQRPVHVPPGRRRGPGDQQRLRRRPRRGPHPVVPAARPRARRRTRPSTSASRRASP